MRLDVDSAPEPSTIAMLVTGAAFAVGAWGVAKYRGRRKDGKEE
ncbi:MAG: PEP-CTERM sorting domain-containing protein [Nanoarchaeota archaeon]